MLVKVRAWALESLTLVFATGPQQKKKSYNRAQLRFPSFNLISQAASRIIVETPLTVYRIRSNSDAHDTDSSLYNNYMPSSAT